MAETSTCIRPLNIIMDKVYFFQLGEEECPKSIWDFIKDQEHELKADDDLSMNECFLYLIYCFMNISQESIKKLEDNTSKST